MEKKIFMLILFAGATVATHELWSNFFTMMLMIAALSSAIIVAGIDLVRRRKK